MKIWIAYFETGRICNMNSKVVLVLYSRTQLIFFALIIIFLLWPNYVFYKMLGPNHWLQQDINKCFLWNHLAGLTQKRKLVLTYCVSKCVHFAAVILEINFQFLAYMWCPNMSKLPHVRIFQFWPRNSWQSGFEVWKFTKRGKSSMIKNF